MNVPHCRHFRLYLRFVVLPIGPLLPFVQYCHPAEGDLYPGGLITGCIFLFPG